MTYLYYVRSHERYTGVTYSGGSKQLTLNSDAVLMLRLTDFELVELKHKMPDADFIMDRSVNRTKDTRTELEVRKPYLIPPFNGTVSLPNVTLLCVDCVDPIRAVKVLVKSMERIKFGRVELFTNVKTKTDSTIYCLPRNEKILLNQIKKITNRTEYSKFVAKDLYKYLETAFCLIIQHDGYVINPSAWKDEFLNYDYIGAPYVDGLVGTGGFSLRSKRLMEFVSNSIEDVFDTKSYHPEDEIISKRYRDILKTFGFKFAPFLVAERFSADSIEYTGQFGFHNPFLTTNLPDDVQTKESVNRETCNEHPSTGGNSKR